MQKSTWKTIDRFEGVARRTSDFVSGPVGTHAAFGLIAFWLGAALAVGWNLAYDVVEEIVTMSSFLLLFLNRSIRAVGPLVLAFTFVLMVGVHLATLEPVMRAADAVARCLNITTATTNSAVVPANAGTHTPQRILL